MLQLARVPGALANHGLGNHGFAGGVGGGIAGLAAISALVLLFLFKKMKASHQLETDGGTALTREAASISE
jgi:hypothetical protein